MFDNQANLDEDLPVLISMQITQKYGIFTTENHIEHSENGCYDKCYYGEYYQLFDIT